MSSLCPSAPKPRIRRSWHTSFKIKVKLGLISQSILKTEGVPKSDISRWKNDSFADIAGAEYSNLDQNIDIVKEFLKHPGLVRFVKGLICLLRIKNNLIEYIKRGLLLGRITHETKELVVHAVDRARTVFTLDKILGYFKISVARFYLWHHQVKTKCLETVTKVCPRVYPSQLSKSEIKIISDMLQDPRFESWSIFAIAAQAHKEGILSAHPSTWSRYAKLLNIKREKPKSRRNYPAGIRALSPLRILHLDSTLYKPLDNSKVYIYLLMDNFSRFILAWLASLRCCGEDCLKNIKTAYWKYILPALQKSAQPVKLVSDGGPENKVIHEFTKETIPFDIQWLIAQSVEFRQSNSMIEAVNKTVKYSFLYRQDLPNFAATVKYLDTAIPEYNNRPHSKLNGLAPQEVLNGVVFDKEAYQKKIEEARIMRIEENRRVRCANCDEKLEKLIITAGGLGENRA